MSTTKTDNRSSTAWQVIIAFGVVSLFGDIIYEGARSVNGPYLKALGASAAMVGLIAGIGEFLGYITRIASGYFADRKKAYWLFTFIGYGLLASVPLLSLAGGWKLAALFIVLERFGKAVRAPAKDTILSTATRRVGTGIGFGLHEAMDQAGALLGPLVFTAVLALGAGSDISLFKSGYSWMWLPFALLMVSVLFAFFKVPDPEKLEPIPETKIESDRLSRVFWLYTVFTFVTTLGFVGWPLLSFHYAAVGVLPGAQIALFYAIAMAVDGLVALLIGFVYDKLKKRSGSENGGLVSLVAIPLLTILIPIIGFGGTKTAAIIAAVVWGIVMGTHETIMKSAIADITPIHKRGTGYGIFNTAYGLAILISSTVLGLLYDMNHSVLIGIAVAAEVAAIPLFFIMKREAGKAYPIK
jgi:MFS family permease